MCNQNQIEKWMKDTILHLPKKATLVSQNYSGMTPIPISDMVYNAMLLNCFQPQFKFLGKIRTTFREIDPQLFWFLLFC